MFNVDYKETYYLVDRDKGRTVELGNFDKMIRYISHIVNFRKGCFREKFPYEKFDFSGNDKGYVSVVECDWKKCPVHSYRNGSVEIDRWELRYVQVDRLKMMARPYMVIDSNGRIVDIRRFETQIKAAQESRSDWRYYNKKLGEDFEVGEKFIPYAWLDNPKPVSRYRCGPVFGIHKRNRWFRYCRNSKLFHNFRLSQNPEAKVRNKAKIEHWDMWDDCYRHIDRSWKTNSKCRHQWEKHLSH